MSGKSLARFANTVNNCLVQAIDAFFFFSIHHAKAKFGLTFGTFANANGQLAAQIILDERGFVSGFPPIPGVGAEGREIARLAVGST